jgi:hypothetical protein
MQRLQSKVLRTTGNFPRQQAEVIQNHENEQVREARHRKYKMLKLGGGEAYDRSCD